MLAIGKPPSMSIEDYMKHIESMLPLIIQPKLDGIRCIINEERRARTRTLKPIPNKWIARTLRSMALPPGIDGEILTYNKEGTIDSFNDISSKVMTEQGTPDFKYHIFDYVSNYSYLDRMIIVNGFGILEQPFLKLVDINVCYNMHEVLVRHDMNLRAGFEGSILRTDKGAYKHGRVTLKQSFLMKLKPRERGEAIIVGFEELMHNENREEVDERGYMKRSHHKENLVPSGMLGAFMVKDLKSGVCFNVGNGFTEEQRKMYWRHRYMTGLGVNSVFPLTGQIIVYEYSEVRSKKDKPMEIVFKGFRDRKDI